MKLIITESRHDKINNVAVRPAKTQISLGIRPVWSDSSLSACRILGFLATHWAQSEDSDQTGRMPRLICEWLRSDWADAQADLSLRWAHTHFVSFVMSRLNYQVPLLHHLNTVLIFLDWWPCIQFTILRRTGTHRRSLTTFMICTVLSWCATPVVW